MVETVARPALEFDQAFLERLEYLNLVAKKILAGILRADRKSNRKGSSAEFADYRPYVAGDDIRRVDWHLFGRLEEVFLKLYREEENLHFTILLDVSSSMDRGVHHKLNFASKVAAALAYIGLSNMDAVNLLPFHGRIDQGLFAQKGRGKIFSVFERLRTVTPGGATSFATAMKEFVTREKRRGVVVVISDFYDLDGFQQGLKYLKYPRHDVYAIHVIDEEDDAPPVRGDLRLVDSETGESREIVVTDDLIARYHEALEKLRDSVERFCIRNEMGYARTGSAVAFDDLVMRILRRGGLLQ